MNIGEYKKILKETTIVEYPAYYQHKLIKFLKDEKIIYNDRRYKKEDDLFDVTQYDKASEKLSYIIDELDGGIKAIENFEYSRGYRYCTLFSINNYSDELLEGLKKENRIIEYSEDNATIDQVASIAKNPTYKVCDDKTILKFSFLLTNKEKKEKRIKYPVLAIIHKEINTLEIRLDTVQFEYRTNETFYKDKVNDVLAWLKNLLTLDKEKNQCIQIGNINFQAVVKFMRAQKTDEVTIVALKMRREGMVAYLDAAANEDLTIPILGELKKVLNKNEKLFSSTKETLLIKKLMWEFIEEIEETSSLPSVKVLWGDKKIKVLLTHEYQKEEYTLFKYSDELGNEEMMNYVTKYIINCKRELDEEFDN